MYLDHFFLRFQPPPQRKHNFDIMKNNYDEISQIYVGSHKKWYIFVGF